MKIFMGLTEVSGYYKNLKKGFEQLGIECTFVVYYESKFSYGGSDEPNSLVKFVKYLCEKVGRIPSNQLLKRVWWRFIRDLAKIPLFIWALFTHDVFIFGSNSTFFVPRFFSFYDYPIIKLFRKKIICQFHGSDSRPPYINGGFLNNGRKVSIDECIELSKKKKEMINFMEKYADYMVDVPPQGLFHEKPFIIGLLFGIPYDRPKGILVESASKGSSVRILHAPSAAALKGTPEIRRTIKNLKSKGFQIDYVEIQGVSNKVVLQELSKCDFVVDQLYSDTPMPGLAAEAASFGKPTVIAGYASAHWRRWLSDSDIPPTHYCQPDELETSIVKLIIDEEYRVRLGEKAQRFIETNWTPKKVAERYLTLLRGDAPDHWWFDAKNIDYIYGCGLPQEMTKKVVAGMVQKEGIQSLRLSDKPHIEEMFEKFLRTS